MFIIFSLTNVGGEFYSCAYKPNVWPNINILLRKKYLAKNWNPCIFYFPIGLVVIKLKHLKFARGKI
jgi:hypothetical protein